jgi:ATP-dependent DNA helicase RecQ
MHERFLDDILDPALREEKRRGTIALFDIVERRACRHRAIVAHFDEAIDDCGDACDTCRGVSVEELAADAMLRYGVGKRGGRRPGSAGPARAMPPGRSGLSPGFGRDADPWDEPPPSFDPDADPLFEELRALRKRLADERGVPAYIIFNDRVLRAMADHRPATANELLRISGVGPRKLEQYGDLFLKVIARA